MFTFWRIFGEFRYKPKAMQYQYGSALLKYILEKYYPYDVLT